MFADVTSEYGVPTRMSTCIILEYLDVTSGNITMPQEIFGVLGTDLYMAVDQTLSPPRMRVWLARLECAVC